MTNQNEPKNTFPKIVFYVFIIALFISIFGFLLESFSIFFFGAPIALVSFVLFLILPVKTNDNESKVRLTQTEREFKHIIVSNNSSSNNDWICPYCETKNLAKSLKCTNCDSTRDKDIINEEIKDSENINKLKCKCCEKEININDTSAYRVKDDFLCIKCYKSFYENNLIKINKLQQKIKKQYLSMLIGMLIGFIIGITLFFVLGVNIPEYRPFRWPVLIYLTISFASLFPLLYIIIVLFAGEISNPVAIFLLVICLIASIVGAPIYTIYKLIINFINLLRLKELKKMNQMVVADINNGSSSESNLGDYSNPENRNKKNLLLAKIEKSYK